MRVYSNHVVRFSGIPSGILVRASSPERAIEEAIKYENGSFARLYAGRPQLSLEDLLAVETLPEGAPLNVRF